MSPIAFILNIVIAAGVNALPFVFLMRGKNNWVTRTVLMKFTSVVFRKTSIGTHSISPKAAQETLLTRAHNPETNITEVETSN